MHAVSRLLGAASDAGGPSAVAEALVSEARHFFRARSTLLLSVAELEGRLEVVAESPAGAPRDGFIPLVESVSIGRLLGSREPGVRVAGPEAAALARALGTDSTTQTALLLPMRVRESVRHVLVLTDAEKREFSQDDVEVARAFADAAAAGLARLAGARGRGRNSAVGVLVLPTLAAVVLADLSGLSKGEVERIWLPFVPWVLVATTTLVSGPRARRGWLAAGAAVALLVQALLRTTW
jgi:hypothetical protein